MSEPDSSERPAPPRATKKNPYLDAAGVAEFLGVEYATIRRYKSRGMLPVPDVQEGGETYQPDDLIPVMGRGADPDRGIPAGFRFPLPADPKRPWTEREKIRARARWRQSTIVAWNESRKGQGWWGRRSPVPAKPTRSRRREEGVLIKTAP